MKIYVKRIFCFFTRNRIKTLILLPGTYCCNLSWFRILCFVLKRKIRLSLLSTFTMLTNRLMIDSCIDREFMHCLRTSLSCCVYKLAFERTLFAAFVPKRSLYFALNIEICVINYFALQEEPGSLPCLPVSVVEVAVLLDDANPARFLLWLFVAGLV